MRITIELDQRDVERFERALARSHDLSRSMDETDIVDAAKQALDTLPLASAPEYVRKRLSGVQRLIMMIEDDAWALPAPERQDVLATLVYFSDPDDLIPDNIELIGLFDDAIVLEVLLRRLRHVLRAYTDFCAFRTELHSTANVAQARLECAGTLARKRDALRTRMRRRARGQPTES